jgi:poly-gamma-glutamate synthesis protein (capsule biosynthesis protein)
MAQALCNLGVDVIVGGHAHVVQPIQVLTNQKDPTRSTLCLYSLGNAVSNIRTSITRPAETEDGMLFSFTLAKYSDGSVIVESTDVLSTWVNRYTSAQTGREVFAIIPLDPQVEDWKTAFDLSDRTLNQAKASLKRSQTVLSEGLTNANAFYAQQQSELESRLGIGTHS